MKHLLLRAILQLCTNKKLFKNMTNNRKLKASFSGKIPQNPIRQGFENTFSDPTNYKSSIATQIISCFLLKVKTFEG